MKPNVDPKDFVANYELNDYRYDQFWEGREYEHLSEYHLLLKIIKKYLPDLSKRRIIDIGGAYGRLSPLYAHTAKETILSDYSTKELKAGMHGLKNTYGNKIKYVALNAYKMPFTEKSLDAVLSVRVMHHLKDTEIFFSELFRVLSPGGVAVIEFAHKNHILAILRNLFHIKSFLNKGVLKVSHVTEESQGISEGQVSIMYNFSVAHVKEIANKVGFDVKNTYSCSFLRVGLLKKLFPTAFLLSLEKIFQVILNRLYLTPSVFIVLRKPGIFTPKKNSLSDILGCPICNKPTKVQDKTYICENSHAFSQATKDIIDLRDPRPEKIDF